MVINILSVCQTKRIIHVCYQDYANDHVVLHDADLVQMNDSILVQDESRRLKKIFQ